MSPDDIITTIVAEAGGFVFVLGGLAAWLGKVWSDRISEKLKTANAGEIENLKSTLELARTRELRISDARFQLYSGIWNALQDVKTWGGSPLETGRP